MACGTGLSAVRNLAKTMNEQGVGSDDEAMLRGETKDTLRASASKESTADEVLSDGEGRDGEVDMLVRMARPGRSYTSLDLPEPASFLSSQQTELYRRMYLNKDSDSDEEAESEPSEESASDDEEEGAVARPRTLGSAVLPTRTITLGPDEFPALSSFLTPQEIAAYRSNAPFDDDTSESSVEEEAVVTSGARTRFVTFLDLPEPASFLRPQQRALVSEASSSDNEDSDPEGVVLESATRTRTLGPNDFPELTSFLTPEEIEAYRSYEDSSDSEVSQERDGPQDLGASRPQRGLSNDPFAFPVPPPPPPRFGIRGEDASQLRRRFVRRAFPSPTDYLTKDEIEDLAKSFQ
eukprot:TRINITY_DN20906_c0_g1_i1.p1 TRINITY_DN20906_c0_g1~~TRINITY_DN20906_c0_g1_i1.p1  ORF type:complete len:371 (-),score=71.45 TRINITY_DN20906_c0_g1_i1:157-1206(-)